MPREVSLGGRVGSETGSEEERLPGRESTPFKEKIHLITDNKKVKEERMHDY